MENNNTINRPDVLYNQRINTVDNLRVNSTGLNRNNPDFKIMTAEDSANFITYIEWRGLAKDKNLVVLSSLHHYYYDAEEMKKVRTVINLKELNQIKELKSFLHSIFHVMPQKSNFIGSFVDNKKNNGYVLRNNSSSSPNESGVNDIENGIVSRIPFINMLFSLMDLKTNKYLSKKSVSLLLKDHGFRVIDMTELNGLTFFHSQKIGTTGN